RVYPARGRDPEEPDVHEVLHGADRAVAVAADGADPAGAHPPAVLVPGVDLQLLLLGTPDVRLALGREVAAAGAPVGRRPDADRRDPRQNAAAGAADSPPPARRCDCREMDPRPAGGGRLLGRD